MARARLPEQRRLSDATLSTPPKLGEPVWPLHRSTPMGVTRLIVASLFMSTFARACTVRAHERHDRYMPKSSTIDVQATQPRARNVLGHWNDIPIEASELPRSVSIVSTTGELVMAVAFRRVGWRRCDRWAFSNGLLSSSGFKYT